MTIPLLDARGGDLSALQALRRRSLEDVAPEVERIVREIMTAVRERGDEAVVHYTRRFDCPDFTPEQLVVQAADFEAAYEQISDEWIGAFRRARENVQRFQERARQQSWLETFDGLILGHYVKPIESAAVYVPASAAPLPSSLLMSVVPARVAGVERVVLATPPRKDGSVHPTMLVAAAECGVDVAYRMGGAQAIAALAYGTERVEPVVKVVGPGPSWVSVAKKMVFGKVGIESIAGPSESLIIADEQADVQLVAADMISQAEHTGDNAVILITPDDRLAREVVGVVERQLETLQRADLVRRSLEDCGAVVITASLSQAVEIANDIAPEHLQLMVAEPFALLESVRNAGCVFLGPLAPVPIGDYAAGPSHVLPTNGTARFSSPLSVNDFLTVSSVIYANQHGFARLAREVEILAEAEGLTGHAESVRKRQA